MAKKKRVKTEFKTLDDHYSDVLASMVDLLESARRASARAVNSIMTATYWEVGRRIVELEQGGEKRAEYGEQLVKRLAVDLTDRFGRGFSWVSLYRMRRFYLAYQEILSTLLTRLEAFSETEKAQTVSGQSASEILQTSSETTAKASRQSGDEILSSLLTKLQALSGEHLTVIRAIADCFPLPWGHYLKLISLDDENARRFYEEEALRGGWSVRQLNRQINSQFYERTLLSKNKAAMLRKGTAPSPEDAVTPEEEVKDPLVLEFLDLKDEYSETDLEDALINKLEEFLLELGNDFTFVGRQRRLRIGDEWYRLDLLFFHRRLRCLVVIDLKLGRFAHADVGQMHMYLNYAAEHWTHEDENPPVGLSLCAQNDRAVARYALDGLPNKVMAAEYKLALPDEAALVAELEKTQRQFAQAHATSDKPPALNAPKKPTDTKKSSKKKSGRTKATAKRKK